MIYSQPVILSGRKFAPQGNNSTNRTREKNKESKSWQTTDFGGDSEPIKYEKTRTSNPLITMWFRTAFRRKSLWLLLAKFLLGEWSFRFLLWSPDFLKSVFSICHSIRITCQSGRVKGFERCFKVEDRWRISRRQQNHRPCLGHKISFMSPIWGEKSPLRYWAPFGDYKAHWGIKYALF